MKYECVYPLKKKDEDVGIDLPVLYPSRVHAKSMDRIYTSARFEFPKYGKVRRFLQRMLLGFEIVGLAGLIWPRSKSDMLVGAGVIDTGYRGEIVSKVYNTRNSDKFVEGSIVQMVLIPNIKVDLRRDKVKQNTERGTTGGIWNTDSGKQK